MALEIHPDRIPLNGLAYGPALFIGNLELPYGRLFVNLRESDTAEARRLAGRLLADSNRSAGRTPGTDLGSAEWRRQVVGLESVGFWRQRHHGQA
jgi:hypothetical protein